MWQAMIKAARMKGDAGKACLRGSAKLLHRLVGSIAEEQFRQDSPAAEVLLREALLVRHLSCSLHNNVQILHLSNTTSAYRTKCMRSVFLNEVTFPEANVHH